MRKLFQSAIVAASCLAGSPLAAADLGLVKKPAPVEYVRVCNAYGAGFFYIPGTQNCLRIGARARFEYQYNEPFNRATSRTGFRVSARPFVDARTETEYGKLRTYFRLNMYRATGTLRSGTQEALGAAEFPSAAGVDFVGKAQTLITVQDAFIQLGGFTAGRTVSFFEFFGPSGLTFIGVEGQTSQTNPGTNLFAYTHSFGGGFSGTLSIEDAIEHRNRTFSPAFLGAAAGTTFGFGGFNMPDIVGQVRYDADWGALQINALTHEFNFVALNVAGVPSATGSPAPDAEYGYGVRGGARINLPFLAKGDTLWLQADYGQGIPLGYLFGDSCGLGGTTQCGQGRLANLPTLDAVVTSPVAGVFRPKLTTTTGFTGAIQHFYLPNLRQTVFGSYLRLDYARSTFVPDGDIGRIGTNLIWSPISQLDIGGEVMYSRFTASREFLGAPGVPAAFTGTRREQDYWQFRSRVQREF